MITKTTKILKNIAIFTFFVLLFVIMKSVNLASAEHLYASVCNSDNVEKMSEISLTASPKHHPFSCR